jgi:hypothetical protein
MCLEDLLSSCAPSEHTLPPIGTQDAEASETSLLLFAFVLSYNPNTSKFACDPGGFQYPHRHNYSTISCESYKIGIKLIKSDDR